MPFRIFRFLFFIPNFKQKNGRTDEIKVIEKKNKIK